MLSSLTHARMQNIRSMKYMKVDLLFMVTFSCFVVFNGFIIMNITVIIAIITIVVMFMKKLISVNSYIIILIIFFIVIVISHRNPIVFSDLCRDVLDISTSLSRIHVCRLVRETLCPLQYSAIYFYCFTRNTVMY